MPLTSRILPVLVGHVAEQIFAGQSSDIGLGLVDHDDLVRIDDYVERNHDHVRGSGALHRRTVRRRVVGDHDDRVIAGVDELVDRADLRGDILADADHLEFGHVRLHVGLFDIGLRGLHHLDTPGVADVTVDEGDAERTFLCRVLQILHVGVPRREASRVRARSADLLGTGHRAAGEECRQGQGGNPPESIGERARFDVHCSSSLFIDVPGLLLCAQKRMLPG